MRIKIRLYHRLKHLFLAILMFVGTVAGIAEARTSEVFSTVAVEAQLVTAQDGIAPGSSILSAGLYLKLGDGWKTYWRSPGEVGYPPEIDWSASENVADIEMLWPAPERFTAFGIENFGYSKEVLFPLQITLKEAGKPVELAIDVNVLTCSTVCVPEEFSLNVSLPNDLTRDERSSELISKYLAKVPEDEPLEYANAFVPEDFSSLVFEVEARAPFSSPDVFPELGEGTALGKPDIRVSADGKRLWAGFPILSVDQDNYSDPVVTVTDQGGRAFTVTPAVIDAAPTPPYKLARSGPGLSELAWIALIALLGGFILNAMPCVLPVLSIKVSSVLKAEGRDRREIRIGFLFSALGVVVFMWVLAAILFALKLIGISVGWGLQFQNPAFVAFIFFILAAFSANLFGLYEISLPPALSKRLSGSGNSGKGYVADFLTGVFGAVLATPCSAPFLGTAVAFALAGRGIDILVVFTALGLGLSLPYLFFALYPNMVTKLPKPGRWMIVLKLVLAVLLAITSAWLLFVLIGLSGIKAGGVIVAGAVLALLLVVKSRWIGAAILSVATVVGIAMLPLTETEVSGTGQIAWVEFDRPQIARLVSQGETVFVDVTADWCLTCKANKALVLERDPVLSVLNSDAVVAMQADWTQPDKRIGAFLESHDRFAIPFNAVFGPSAPQGIVLPEILTTTSVLEAIETASLASR
ncbi:MAG: protein-disulfide reductase DsbD family protein [Paracoccaceae bacterium]|jgi:suppressor for copper-sensitivity B|nr:protein-disulfide reductase DsbD family protein [Paracoccaceae bacterium]MDP7184590.1 protein-disulfide reductase DsbD family protein [Paracoccaceae bacterium]